MKEQQSYSIHYETLNLPYDSDLKSCKNAYKRSVKQWHPDKFSNNVSEQHIAEEKLKEINIAYTEISQYYQINGVMPEAPITVSPKQTKPNFDVSSLYQNLNNNKIHNNRNYKKYFGVLVFSLVLIIIYQSLFNIDKDPVISSTEDPNLTKLQNQRETQNTENSYFSKGSSQQDVIKIHGPPEFRISQTWYYGNSWILFQNGIVTDWYQDKKYPLNSISENDIPYTQSKTIPTTFEKGDSKSDVRIIQGEPVRKSRDVWYYQISKVYFKKDKVTSWFNSPLDPLRVIK